MGLLGNLMASQIVEQLVLARRHLAEAGDPTPIQRMVFMGMGASCGCRERGEKLAGRRGGGRRAD